MSLFNNTYSGLITKGLGMPACALLTMGFGAFGCTITVGPPPPIGNIGGVGGGGSFPTSQFLVPLSTKPRQKTKQVLITVKIGKSSWRRAFIVLNNKADVIVKVVNIVNTVKDKVSVGIEAIRRTSKKVSAVFDRSDK